MDREHIATTISRLLRGSERQCINAKRANHPESAKKYAAQHHALCRVRYEARKNPATARGHLNAVMESFVSK